MVEQENLMTRINRAAGPIDPALTDREVERLIRRAGERRVRRQLQRRALLVTGAAVGAVVLMVVGLRMRDARPVAQVAAPVAPSRSLRLADGSTATPASADATLAVREDSPARVSIDLARGRGRFEVVPNRARAFEVRAGEVSVHVVGTAFTVERVADRVGVAVEHGVVRVEWGVGTKQLTAGQSGWFPPLQVQADAPRATEDEAPAPAPEAAPAATPAATHARPAQSADELLRAADAERLAGHPQEGARLLQRLLREHRSDPRASLGALTLGRLLMIELGKPRQAAAAFADARALAPQGPFAEDALAREVEAWSKAGDAVTAGKRARLYLDRYPNGHRADTVKAFGGVE